MPEEPMASAGETTLADLGEWTLIERLARFAPPGQFDDDAALIASGGSDPAADLVVNTDLLVDTIHFSDRTIGPRDVGWRAAMANLSDLAAMGCTSVLGLTVGLVAPPSTPWSWVEQVYEGLQDALEVSGGLLLGGDCSGGQQRLLAITALGRLPGECGGPIRRSAGKPGDLLLASGVHGLSRLGLALLLQESVPGLEQLDPQREASLRSRAIRAHRRPRGRLDVVEALGRCRPPQAPWRVAGTDSSDGLLAAVGAIARASRCQATLERRALPLDPAMARLDQGEAWCLNGGEDFELVLALEPTWAHRLQEQVAGSVLIGALTAAESLPLPQLTWAEDGTAINAPAPGYTHFQGLAGP
jgi:thiamine-monophosphate kinase